MFPITFGGGACVCVGGGGHNNHGFSTASKSAVFVFK